jgi:RNA polymerase sigma-70 factor (ECF subfamily)
LAIAELYRTYHRPLLAFVSRLTTGDRHLAEDVVQETMIRAWQNLHHLDSESESLMPWLATVARNVLIDHQRRRASRPQEANEAQLENLQISDEIDGLLRSVLVSEALKSLSPAHREVLTATILADRTVNEAAEELQIPVGTVKSRVYYATRALRVALDEKGVTA